MMIDGYPPNMRAFDNVSDGKGRAPKPDEDLQAVGVCGDSPELEDPVRAYARDVGEKRAECEPYAGGSHYRYVRGHRVPYPRAEG